MFPSPLTYYRERAPRAQTDGNLGTKLPLVASQLQSDRHPFGVACSKSKTDAAKPAWEEMSAPKVHFREKNINVEDNSPQESPYLPLGERERCLVLAYLDISLLLVPCSAL